MYRKTRYTIRPLSRKSRSDLPTNRWPTQNLHDVWGLGKSWQEAFETDDRNQVEEHRRDNGIEFRWSDQGLWTRTVCPGIIEHPETGEPVWFNQADLWHISSRGPDHEEKLLRVLGEAGLPSNATYGDGTPITSSELAAVRLASHEAETSLPWRREDLLVLDNALVDHGRKPFKGTRRVLLAMSNRCRAVKKSGWLHQ